MTRSAVDPEWIEELRRQIDVKREELAAQPAAPGMLPLKIACRMSSCKHGRHCLDYLRRPHRGFDATGVGDCRDCGVHIVDLPESGGRRYGEASELLETCVDQQGELIRAHYWHAPIDLWAYNQALRLGRQELNRRVADSIRKALSRDDAFVGRQTPYFQNIVAYAQHAVAGCCRRCAAYWHGLPERDMPTAKQLDHVIAAAQAYLHLRLPDLSDDPKRGVPSIQPRSLPTSEQTAELDEWLQRHIAARGDPTGLLRPVLSRIRLHDHLDRAGGGYLTATLATTSASKS
ncbi:MAG: hypothetical protein QOC82_863 [Frankiaceae bacterium]|jgi:hypothetical protein|nr:hypothetical protein [Frankiaceae bacterium]